jgi:antitoxin HicB
MEERTYTVKIEPCEEGGFWAYVPALPGCFTQGETLEEVIHMAKEAIEGFINSLAAHGQEIPVEKIHPQRVTLGIQVRTPVRT